MFIKQISFMEIYMNKLYTLLLASVISTFSVQVYSEPVDGNPPAQNQKEILPNSTENGNYLEKQPADSTDTNTSNEQHNVNKDSNHHTIKSKSKGKNTSDKPKHGGVEVNAK